MNANTPTSLSFETDAISVVDQLRERFEHAWQTEAKAPEIDRFLREASCGDVPLMSMAMLELVCLDISLRWREPNPSDRIDDQSSLGTRPTADDYAKLLLKGESKSPPMRWIEAEYLARIQSDEPGRVDELRAHYANRPEIAKRLQDLQVKDSLPDTHFKTCVATNRPTNTSIRCPNCGLENRASELGDTTAFHCIGCNTRLRFIAPEPMLAAQFPSTRFQFQEKIGNGSFGVVWKAFDLQLKRLVAVKQPHPTVLNQAVRERFLRESRAAAKLHHEGIVSVYDVCTTQNDAPVIVSEFIDGPNLAERIAKEKMIGIRKAVGLASQLADALSHAHSQGIIHRDLKPGNILIDAAGKPHVADFGLAKDFQNDVALTCDGDVLGTAAYMSPEQARGEGSEADLRCDLYALGVILFELVTGERPFRGTVQMLLHQVIHDQHPSPRKLNSSVPTDVETIIMKCLEKSPENRYQSAGELRDDLQRFLNYEPIHATPPTPLDRLIRWYPSHATEMLGTYFIIAPLTWVFFIIGGLWDADRTDSLALSSPVFLPWALIWIAVGSYILKKNHWCEAISALLLLGFMSLPIFINDNSQSITLICLISFFGTALHIGSLISRWLRRHTATD
ncbi:Serine/threonine-protein kinase PknB [Rosistilla carotiformis]|uniref:non-specific serine/threonine protein kinase n=1 Tax=Rosistilla carotiformis TaxID=2528017 RepID=A0A518K030_9BACT|nr:serine/threonine-protein kinase [Rosistilla carotiformis]QDV71085.1 Serine/threonine-protein kinase PknB [Rosistilla carotiformis]